MSPREPGSRRETGGREELGPAARGALRRLRIAARAALAWVALASALLLAAASRAAATAPTVIVLAWDGVRHDFPDRGTFPGLARMERGGIRAARLVPPFPSATFPSLVTLATGTYPDRHGIVDNRFLDRERGVFSRDADPSWIEAEPIWVAAERQGVRAAVFFWVGSEGPWRGRSASYFEAPFDTRVGEDEKVDRILSWLELPPRRRPGLILSWWHGTDHVGHLRGPDHPEIARQLAREDRALSRLLAALDERRAWDRTTLIVVSDHGMAEVSERLAPGRLLERAHVEARVFAGGAVAHVFFADPKDLARSRALLAARLEAEVWRGSELPASLRLRHPRRTGDLVLIAAPPRAFVLPGGPLSGLASLLGRKRGMHGYRPELPEMGGILYALGRGVPSGQRIGAVRAIDVAPTVARLLGIQPPREAEGRPLEAIGRELSRAREGAGARPRSRASRRRRALAR